MPFVKLDCAMLRSTTWFDLEARNVFITALLMAEPREFAEPVQQIAVDSLTPTGWEAPPDWYGFVAASGPGILDAAKMGTVEVLRRLGEPDLESRNPAHEGRRMIRVHGGYLVLNFIRYREKDATAADRQKRWRERAKTAAARVTRSNARRRSRNAK